MQRPKRGTGKFHRLFQLRVNCLLRRLERIRDTRKKPIRRRRRSYLSFFFTLHFHHFLCFARAHDFIVFRPSTLLHIDRAAADEYFVDFRRDESEHKVTHLHPSQRAKKINRNFNLVKLCQMRRLERRIRSIRVSDRQTSQGHLVPPHAARAQCARRRRSLPKLHQ